MTYSYQCESCNHHWDANYPIDDRDSPLKQPCPACDASGQVRRLVASPAISYAGAKTVLQRAGSGWNDVLNKVKKGSGRKTNIETR
jgi:putative FmdB family regulatory protein